MNIKTINSRIRRGDTSYSTRQLISRASQLGMLTPSGYIRTAKGGSNALFEKAIQDYEESYFSEKTDEYFTVKQDILSLVMEYVTPSELYQEMRKAQNSNIFAENIADRISEFSIFEEEYQNDILEYLRELWY